jgi:hypothetical protein
LNEVSYAKSTLRNVKQNTDRVYRTRSFAIFCSNWEKIVRARERRDSFELILALLEKTRS